MAGHITIRFHAELNDFLPPERRDTSFAHRFNEAGSIKDLIESLGVPHPEVDVILINGESVDFRYLVRDSDAVDVHPQPLPATPDAIRLRPPLPDPPRFVLDTHLGRLAAYLRMLGFDALYRNDYDDSALARISAEQGRVLLTCDRGLLMRRQVALGYYVRERQPHRQVSELVTRLRLRDALRPFTRCMSCNGPLLPVSKEAVIEHLPPRVRARHDDFVRCGNCGKIYWEGSHYERMRRLIDTVRQADTAP